MANQTHQDDRGASGVRWGLLALGLFIIVIAALMLLSRSVATDEQTLEFDGITHIEFDVDNAPMTIAGSSEAQGVTVDFSTTIGFLGGSARVEEAGSTLRIVHRCPFFFGFSCKARYDLRVPEGTVISGLTSNGAIRASNLNAEVDIRTSNGAISLESLSGPITARTSNGAIQSEEIRSSAVSLQTSNGRIVINFSGIPQVVDLRTSNGAIDVRLPGDAPPFALTTNTSNGRVDAGIRTDPSAANRIDARTSNGNITIGYR